jgi:hypothetical protein
MAGDLPGGAYPLSYTFRKLTGLASNGAQSNLGVRSNLEWIGLGDLTDAAASLVTADMTVVAVPVEVGDTFSTVTVLVGNTAAGTPTHQWAQLYTGALTTAKAIGTQSTDATTTAIGAKTAYSFTLGSTVQITTGAGSDAPYGYIYVGIGMTATTVPSLVGGNVAANCQYPWFADSPLFFAGTISAAGASAPTSVTLASVSAIATVPAVFLS